MKKMRKRRCFEESAADYAKNCNSAGYLPVSYVTQDGYQLGQWAANVRSGMINLTPERKEILEKIHFLWDVKGYIKSMNDEKEKKKTELRKNKKGKYKSFEEWLSIYDLWNYDGYVPVEFITPEGERIGKWAAQIRFSHRKITEQQREELNKRNFKWKISREERSMWYKKDFMEACIEKRREK